MNLLRYILNWKTFAASAAIAVIGFVGVGAMLSPAAAENCVENDVIKCGYSNPADLVSKLASHPEVTQLYNHAFQTGWSIGDLNDWKARAQGATVYKDGRVILDDGTTIVPAGATYSLGRKQTNDNKKPVTIGNNTWYYGLTSDNFAGSSIHAFVLLNKDDHSLQFAALTPCANPIWGKSAAYKCDMLNKEKVSDNTYKFTTTTKQSGANISKLVYEFGDGATTTITSNFSQAVTHTYNTPGQYTAKVTAYFNVNGKEKSDTRVECTKPVEIPKAVLICSSLEGKLIEGNRKYSFTATGHSENGPKLTSASFDFGDGQKAENVTDVKPVAGKPNDATITVDHKYADTDTGTINISAGLTFTTGSDKANVNCKTQIELKAQTCADKPNAPECKPPTCEEKGTCKVLPSTGPEDSIISAISVGSFAGAGMYYRATRRNWISNIFKFKR